jgi:hypothetical protein
MTDTDLRTHLEHPRYPRSSGYDAGWIVANQMGPTRSGSWRHWCSTRIVASGR